mgnify:CR=1 FL=1|tara:strand:+ start:58 stop:588 length:531 start_codon:yes stop_codon:yes gene_type:complete
MENTTYNLFKNFHSCVFNAASLFLSKNQENSLNKSMTTSLRIPSDLKQFYDCLAEAEMTSINTAIVNTLSKVKEKTIDEYTRMHSDITHSFNYQIKSFLRMANDQKIDINDLPALLEWATNKKVTRFELLNKDNLINLLDKESQIKLCKVFGCNYDWMQNNDSIDVSYQWTTCENR